MGTKSKIIQDLLKTKVFEAVDRGLITPKDVTEYIIDNGWEYETPSKPTIISLLNKCGVVYVHGGWEKAK